MIKILFIEHNGTEHSVEASPDTSVMQAAIDNLVPGIVADCGGSCSCATCHGFVDDAWLSKLPPVAGDEQSLLEGLLEVNDNSRLTCQLKVTPALDGMVIRLPKSQF